MEEQKTYQLNIQNLEALLFYLAEPVSFKKIASFFSVDLETVQKTINELKDSLEGRGLSLVIHDNEVQLTTSGESHEIIEAMRKEELTKDLTKPALETLSIILYKDNVARADIDFIRGVNSSFIIRNLLMRGLIVRKPHPTDARTYVYTASHELLGFLGLSTLQDLPDFERVKGVLEEKIDSLLETQNNQQENEN